MANQSMSNYLEIVTDSEDLKCLAASHIPHSSTVARQRVSSGRKAPPVSRSGSASSTRSQTPTKKVALQSVKRKEELDLLNTETAQLSCQPSTSSPHLDHTRTNTTNQSSHSCNREMLKSQGASRQAGGDSNNTRPIASAAAAAAAACDEEGSSSSEDEPIKAPSELLMEFLDCVMRNDYVNAKKLCTMILLFEPSNTEALKFKDLIEQKLALGETSSSSDDTEDENSSDTDEDSDDADSEAESSSSDEDDAASASSGNTSTNHARQSQRT